jgi:hypothetical protein
MHIYTYIYTHIYTHMHKHKIHTHTYTLCKWIGQGFELSFILVKLPLEAHHHYILFYLFWRWESHDVFTWTGLEL